MTKKQISILAQKSFRNKELDSKKVKLFTAKMKRKELRGYIREIKSIDSQNKVKVFVPNLKVFNKNYVSPLLKHYKGKKIVYGEDPSLIVGIKLVDNDLIYDFNLKNSLENLTERYDI